MNTGDSQARKLPQQLSYHGRPAGGLLRVLTTFAERASCKEHAAIFLRVREAVVWESECLTSSAPDSTRTSDADHSDGLP